jgi:hypothetical protein
MQQGAILLSFNYRDLYGVADIPKNKKINQNGLQKRFAVWF